MRDLFLEVCALQKDYSPNTNPSMVRRGELIRNDIPASISLERKGLVDRMGAFGEDLAIEGRDNTGRYSEIPWVRVYSEDRSPSATVGWYCVYLFAGDGSGVYLSLIHGSTTWTGGSFVSRPTKELAAYTQWARTLLNAHAENDPRLATAIDLKYRVSKVAAAYEKGTALALWYGSDAMPTDDVLYSDLEEFLRYLAVLYNETDLERTPDEATLVVQHHLDNVRPSFTGRTNRHSTKRSTSQGRGLTPIERKVVEDYAMSVAQHELLRLGFSEIQDTSRTSSFDYKCVRDGKETIVEVKGTTGYGQTIIVTVNEVDAHRRSSPDNVLIVVHSIDLDRAASPPVASGGMSEIFDPWTLQEERLLPQTYSYSLQGIPELPLDGADVSEAQ